MNDSERAAERLARIRARRGTPERVAAVEAIRAAQAPPRAGRPEGEVREGFAFELRKGDWVTTVGGRDGNTMHKRMRFEDRVEAAGATPRQRTRGHVIFERCGDWTFPTRTPVRFIRPNSEEA